MQARSGAIRNQITLCQLDGSTAAYTQFLSQPSLQEQCVEMLANMRSAWHHSGHEIASVLQLILCRVEKAWVQG